MKTVGILLLFLALAYGYHRYTEDQHTRALIAAHTFAIGSTIDDVIEAKGTPTGRIADGHHDTLSYPDVVIDFDDGRVVESHAPPLPAPTPPPLYRSAGGALAAPPAAPGSWMWDKNHHSPLDAPSPKPSRRGGMPAPPNSP